MTTAQYRKAHKAESDHLVILETLMARYPINSAIVVTALSTHEELSLITDAADRASRADQVLLFAGINCEYCARPHGDDGCNHHRISFLRGLDDE